VPAGRRFWAQSVTNPQIKPGFVSQAAAQRIGLHVVCERPAAVDLHHRQPLPVPGLELCIAADIDLAQVERNLVAHGEQDRACALAQVAALRVVEDDLPTYG
jgi:hypothetical protein